MPTLRVRGNYYVEVHRAITPDHVRVTACCCKRPAAGRRECARATGNKTACRCICHANGLVPGELGR